MRDLAAIEQILAKYKRLSLKKKKKIFSPRKKKKDLKFLIFFFSGENRGFSGFGFLIRPFLFLVLILRLFFPRFNSWFYFSNRQLEVNVFRMEKKICSLINFIIYKSQIWSRTIRKRGRRKIKIYFIISLCAINRLIRVNMKARLESSRKKKAFPKAFKTQDV